MKVFRQAGKKAISKMSCDIRKKFTVIFGICFVFFFAGSSRADSTIPDVSVKREPLLKIAVFPFQQIFPEDLQKGAVESPLTGAVFDAVKSSGNPEGILEERFRGYLEKNRHEFDFIAGERAAAVFRKVSTSSMKISLRSALCEAGKELGADLAVAGYLYRFRELQGESFSAERPASVAFEIVMMNVDDGKVVWRGSFDRTQRSLLENLFQAASFFQGKGRWLKAEALAAQGLDEVMKTFPTFPQDSDTESLTR